MYIDTEAGTALNYGTRARATILLPYGFFLLLHNIFIGCLITFLPRLIRRRLSPFNYKIEWYLITLLMKYVNICCIVATHIWGDRE